MPYRNIYWIKLEKRLLNDTRFYLLNEKTQLLFVKLLLLAAQTNNKIPKNAKLIKSLIRSKSTTKSIEKGLADISQNFPKFKEKGGFYYFSEWSNRVNQTKPKGYPKDNPGISQGYARDMPIREDKRRKDKIRKDKKGNKFINMWKTFKKNHFNWER